MTVCIILLDLWKCLTNPEIVKSLPTRFLCPKSNHQSLLNTLTDVTVAILNWSWRPISVLGCLVLILSLSGHDFVVLCALLLWSPPNVDRDHTHPLTNSISNQTATQPPQPPPRPLQPNKQPCLPSTASSIASPSRRERHQSR